MKTAEMTVDYVDHMGSDLSVVNAARVSFDKHSDTFVDQDAKLIGYLAKHNHWSPFAHTSIQLRVTAPIFVARQLVKHQVGGVWNEVSRRYVDDEPEFWFPKVWRARPDGSMKQGSSDQVANYASKIAVYAAGVALDAYTHAIESGVAPELARILLPTNIMTSWYWTGSAMFFARVCKLRLDAHAQAETREVAQLIDAHCRRLFPVSWAALVGEAP